jgi:CSLREA domain-containing protein
MRTGRMQAGVILVLAMAVVARAATITVNSTDDSLASDGNCTLREAILAANNDTAVDGCAAGSGPDVVVVPAGTYQLTGPLGGVDEDAGLTGDLDVTDDLELFGAGAGTTSILAPIPCSFICPPGGRVLDVDPAGAGISVRVSGVTLRGGFIGVDEGGAIRNRGTLVVADSVVEGIMGATAPVSAARNQGGGIFSLGPLRIERSVIRDNAAGFGFQSVQSAGLGGGISALGPLEVIDSTIAGNRVASSDTAPGIGAGISAAGPVNLVRSTMSGNTASTGGGLAAGDATLVNSTISGNTGGGIVAGGTVELSNATITENVGGGVTAGSVVLRNTIVAGNAPVDCVVGSTTGGAYNIDGDGSCGLSGSDQPRVYPLLGPLADNGGPTFTHGLLAGSPAIDMGSPAVPGSGGTACEATDQRGVARPDGPRCDVGAFEGTDTTTTPPPCPHLPRVDCQPALGERSRLALKSVAAHHTRDKLSWSWVGSAPVPVGDFADPVGDAANYALCVYDGTGLPRLRALRAPAGGTCGKAPCWRSTSSGFTYTDPLLDPDGLRKIVLSTGGAAGKAKITVQGKGANLGLSLPIAAPVRMQLVHSGGAPTCWDATFSTSTRNDGETFNARSDP